MANESNDISDIVKKCKILLLDIEGTTTSISFVKDKLFPYAEENVQEFLKNEWETDDVKEAVAALRKLAVEDKENNVDGVVTIPGEDASKEDQIEGLVKSVKWQMSSDRKVGALKLLQGLIWKQGYDKGEIKGHVYDDVSPALELWQSVEDQKVYIYSSGSVQAQKLLFGSTLAGDLLKFIDGHFDTAVGAKQEAASYTAIAEKIGSKPEEILFLTDIVKEAEAARLSGLNAALVSREGNAALPADAAASYAVLYSFDQLSTNKRKPDAQDEQPAKVAKTDVDDDVKTAAAEATKADTVPVAEANGTDKAPAAETVTKEEIPTTNGATAEKAAEEPVKEVVPEVAPSKPSDEPEKMDVEEEVVTKESTDSKTDTATEKVETVIEEITDSNEVPPDATVCDVEPVIEESSDKTDTKETEKMETESVEVADSSDSKELKNGEKDAPVPEETPPATVVTEIEEVTNGKEGLSEVAEMIEDLQPVIEEPPAQDMEELQNVGEVLEKECDEILSKVQDVTNLDNIPLKPLLNPIAEETMETDSNDIVDRILDTELEMEMKQCGDIDLNGVQAKEDKLETEEDKNAKKETNNESNNAVTDEKPEETTTKASTEKPTEVSMGTSTETATEKVTEEVKSPKEKESSPTETKAEESKVAPDESTDKTEESKVENKVDTDTKDDKTVEAEKKSDKIPVEAEKQETETKETETNETPTEQSTTETVAAVEKETPVDSKENDKVADDVKVDNETKEAQMNGNGKATNGDAKTVNLNGDASKEEELSARLSMENGKEVVNGANGDSLDADQPKNEKVVDVEVADIKVKSVAMDEPRNDPIEQPTEA